MFSILVFTLFSAPLNHCFNFSAYAQVSETPKSETMKASARPHSHWKDPRPDLMFTVGDSISAGLFANTSANTMPTEDSILSIPKEIERAWNASVKGTASLWDKKDELSWSSGQNLYSHSVYLREYLEKNNQKNGLVVQNVARSGGTTASLALQAADILKIVNSGTYRSVKYITVLIGANDACFDDFPGGTPNDDFVQGIQLFFDQISKIEQPEKIRILIAGMPNIPQLAESDIYDETTLGGRLTCRQMHTKVSHSCLSLLNWTTPEEHAQALQVVITKNDLIKQAAEAAVKKYRNLDVVYTNKLFETKLSIEEMATDCFHPNRFGQASISAILWKEQPWFQPNHSILSDEELNDANASASHVNHDGDGIVVFQKSL